ncbi:unnamed protein product [Phyllotreta striolata]|uniref:Cytochrome P450 n=1 Tax=Phyllotreta striolata TaxID=444603 RepID=A0A9N9TQU6_PHYSR|nr:unnamed protein product [Phyllotreta striolata]
MLVSFIIFVLLPFCYICYKKYEASQFMKNIPCAPGRNFLFGNLLSIKWGKKYSDLLDIHNKLLEKLGPIFKVYVLAYGESLVVADPKFVEYILSSQKLIDKSTYHAFLDSWIGTGLVTGGGAKWRRHRRLIAPSFHFSILRDFIDVFESVGDVFIKKLNKEVGKKSVNISPLVSLCTLDIICEATMGVKLNAQTEVSSDYINAVKTMCKIFISRLFFPIPKYLYWLTPNYYAERKAVKILHNYSDTVVRNKIKENSVVTAENYDGNDVDEKKKLAFLDHLLNINAKGEVLTTAELREEIDTVMFAGHDTVSATISFALYCLAQHPEIQEKVVEEQKAIFSDFKHGKVTLENINEMNYLELVIKECLRLYPPVPFLGRLFSEEVEWEGNVFPQGLNVMISIYAIHRNEEVFPDAEKFYPERFVESSKINSYNYLPFSIGPRNCIGQKFAMLELKTILSKVIRNFRIFPSEPNEKLKLIPNVVLESGNGICIRLEKR